MNDDNNNPLDATLTLEAGATVSFLFRCRGTGKKKVGGVQQSVPYNADYNQALEVILQRIQARSMRITGIFLESSEAIRADPHRPNRRIDVPGVQYPIDLTGRSVAEFRNDLGAAMARMYQKTGTIGGNRQKTILIDVEVGDFVHRELLG